VARRKEIYEALHPEAKAEERRKRGMANLKQYSGDETVSPPEDIPAFTSDAAEKTGLSDVTAFVTAFSLTHKMSRGQI